MNTNPTPGAPAVNAVLGRLHRLAEENDASAMGPVREAAMTRGATSEADVADLLANAFLSIDATNGRFLHLLARARRPGRIVEFAPSPSTLPKFPCPSTSG